MRYLVYALTFLIFATTSAAADYRIEVKIGVNLPYSDTSSLVSENITLFVVDGANTLEARDPLPVAVKIIDATNQRVTLLTEAISQDPNSNTGLLFGRVDYSGHVFFLPIRRFSTSGDPVSVIVNSTILPSKRFKNGYPFSESIIQGFLTEDSFAPTIHAARMVMIQDDSSGSDRDEIRGEFLKLFTGNRDYFRGKANDAQKAFLLLSESMPDGLSDDQLTSILSFLGHLMDTASKSVKNGIGQSVTDAELFDFSLATFLQLALEAKKNGISQRTVSTISLYALNRLNDNKKYDWCLRLFVTLARDELLLSPDNDKATLASIINTVSDCAFFASGADDSWTKEKIAKSLLSKNFDDSLNGKDFMQSFVSTIVALDNSGVVNPTSDLPGYLLDYFSFFRSAVDTVALSISRAEFRWFISS
jgi:hypothetical protein